MARAQLTRIANKALMLELALRFGVSTNTMYVFCRNHNLKYAKGDAIVAAWHDHRASAKTGTSSTEILRVAKPNVPIRKRRRRAMTFDDCVTYLQTHDKRPGAPFPRSSYASILRNRLDRNWSPYRLLDPIGPAQVSTPSSPVPRVPKGWAVADD